MKKFILAILFLLLSICGFNSKVFAASSQFEKAGYHLDFDEEFNGPKLNSSKWTDYYLSHWADNKKDAKANYRFENGKFIEFITKDQKPWAPTLDNDHYGYGTDGVKSSAVQTFNKNWIHNFSGSDKLMSPITTDEEMLGDKATGGYATTYGYFEMKAKLSDVGGGGHQAWWLVGMQNDTNDWFNSQQNGEIDILETFFDYSSGKKGVTDENRLKGLWQVATYGWNDPFFSTSWTDSTTDPLGGSGAVVPGNIGLDSLMNEYHTYAMDWEPGSLKFYFDGKLFRKLHQSPDYPMGMILNIYTDAGSGKHNDVFPKSWSVDYIRVYKKDSGYEIPKQTIKNRQTNEYINLSTNSDKVLVSSKASKYSEWQLVPKGEYFLIKNVATGELLHNQSQKGYVEHGKVPETYYSAQWEKQEIDGYTRFISRWKPDQVINTEKNLGYLKVSPLQSTAWSSQWAVE